MRIVDNDESGVLVADVLKTGSMVFRRMECNGLRGVGGGVVVAGGDVRAGESVANEVETPIENLFGCGGCHAAGKTVDHDG